MTMTCVVCATSAEAARSLAGNPKARLLAGGTLVMRAVNSGDQSFDTVVRITDPALRSVQRTGDRLVLGAQVTMSDLIAHRDTAFLAPVARQVGGPAIRNMATVAGNLFAPSPYGDMATAMLVLDAQVSFADGGPAMPIQELLQSRHELRARVVTSLSIRMPRTPDGFCFHKVSRVRPKGISVMSMAAWLPREGGGLVDVRVAYGAMAPTPVRVPAVEQALNGRALDDAAIQAAVQVATDGLTPPTDALASTWYRNEVAPVHLRRLLSGDLSPRH